MRRFLLIVPILFLAACTPQQQDDTYAIVCSGVSLADSAFQIYATTGKVSARVIENERKAVAAAQAVCSGPRPTDVRAALAAVQRALTAIAEATREARQQAGRA